jgi:hypothetical protein
MKPAADSSIAGVKVAGYLLVRRPENDASAFGQIPQSGECAMSRAKQTPRF